MVRQFEEELGVVLDNGGTWPMTLTAFGLALHNRRSVLSEELFSLKSQALEARRGGKPDLRIGLVDSFAATCGSALTTQLLGQVSLLSVKFLLSSEMLPALTFGSCVELFAAATGMAGGYALWNIGILRGNRTLLVTASYFAPVLSSAFAAV
jgi:drug/metabolite transporter (DMT)-like permease